MNSLHLNNPVLIIGEQQFILLLKPRATLSMSAIISGPMRIPNWNKCHRANKECPEIPRSCGQPGVRTVAAEEHTHNTGTEEIIQGKGKQGK